MAIEETCIYFSTNQLARETEKIAKQVFKPTGMAPTYSYILLAIEEQKAPKLRKLAQTMSYSPSSMSRFIDYLEKKGYVEKEYGWKEVTISLSQKGKLLMPSVHYCFTQMGEFADAILGSSAERHTFVELLQEKVTQFNNESQEEKKI